MGEMQKSQSDKKRCVAKNRRMVFMYVAQTNGICVLGIASHNEPAML